MLRGCILFLLSMTMTAVAYAQTDVRDWAVYVYFCSDEGNDDKGLTKVMWGRIRKMREALQGMSGERPHLIIQHNEPNATARYNVTTENFNKKEYRAINTGDANEFYKFLHWAHKAYPAKNVMLIVGGHGSGIISFRGATSYRDDLSYDDVNVPAFGFLSDESETIGDAFTTYDDTDNDCLTIFEFRRTLEVIQSKFPESNTKAIIFDTCSASMVEVLSELKDVTDYVFGAASYTWFRQIDYEEIVEGLYAGMTHEGWIEYCKRLVKTWIHAVDQDATTGVYDVRNMREFEIELNNFVKALLRAYEITFDRSFRKVASYKDGWYWDIKTLCDSVLNKHADLSNIRFVHEAAERLKVAFNGIQVSTWRRGKYSTDDIKAGGLSIFWPKKEDYNRYRNFYKKLKFSEENLWDEFLDLNLLGVKPKNEIFNVLYE